MKNLLLGCTMLFVWILAAAEGIQEFDYPETKIISIQDHASRFPQSLFFAAEQTEFKQTEKSYEGSVNVFLIVNKKNGAAALIDAGFGETAGGKLSGKLRELKIDPEKVNAVFITHIHPDHVGGLAQAAGKDGTMTPCFPKAAICIAKEEYEAWKKDEKRVRLAQYLTPCESQLKLIDYDKELTGDFGILIPRRAAGHTPGHTVFEKIIPLRTPNEKKESIFFVGDILHAADLQVTNYQYCARFDQDPRMAAETRRKAFLKYNGSWFGAHFPFPGKIRIHQDAPNVFSYKKAK